MKNHKTSLAKVEFKRRDGSYQGSVPMGDLARLSGGPAETMRAVTDIYERSISDIRQWQRDAKSLRQSRTPLSARSAWELGDIVYRLEAGFAGYSCRLENMYDHLARHASTTKWLGSFVTFRRYVDDKETIPADLKWNSIAKKAGTVGQAITAGTLTES